MTLVYSAQPILYALSLVGLILAVCFFATAAINDLIDHNR